MRLNVNAKSFKEDLLWAANSPTMMHPNPRKDAFNAALLGEINQWLLPHQAVPPESIQSCARLGIYFEHLWKYIFEQCPLFELVAHNLPVYRDKQTQGAFDFIYYCHYRQQYFHLEIAVKFYLGTQTDSHTDGQWDYWVGPGGEDRLDLKLNKMLNKQSELARTEEGRALLQTMGIEDITPELLLKGRLFYPLDACSAPPQASNPGHLRGHWLGIDQLARLPEEGEWRSLIRDEWLSDRAQGEFRTFNHVQLAGEIERRFEEYPFPVMLGHIPGSSAPERQLDRYFVTPERWLEDIASQTRS